MCVCRLCLRVAVSCLVSCWVGLVPEDASSPKSLACLARLELTSNPKL